ncbi:MAG: acryloyl-CoA reductase [Nitrospinota bacterium]|nr:MAG: acryloyl-CoA reductase [Nitrospinota bacterium]
MTTETFTAYLVSKTAENTFVPAIVERPLEDLPAGDVLIRVAYSSLNYKDALSATGHPGVTRKFPHIPGIDAAGTVVSSAVEQFRPGDEVLVTGYDLGSNTWGGYAQYIRVPADWVVPLPAGLSLYESMIYGTAGFTAALSVDAMEHNGLSPEKGEVLVTGATGGVGSIAVAILAKIGYRVAAVTGKTTEHDYLRRLGATTILSRDEVNDQSNRPLLSARWAGAVDTVGGNILATILKSTQQHGSVAACGLVAGAELPTTVYPFILRGVNLLGIDSVLCPMEKRRAIWARLASDWKPDHLEEIATTITLAGLQEKIQAILQGKVRGRIVVEPK